MKLYTYCIVRSGTLDQLHMTGLTQQNVYLLPSGTLSVIVSDFEGDAAPITRDNVLTHQRVVTAVLERTTPLPFRFGTLVSEEQLKSYLESRKVALAKNLELVDGCVEMSIKIIWQDSPGAHSLADHLVANRAVDATGTAFLRSKSEQIKGDEELLERANDIGSWLRHRVMPEVRDARLEVNPSQRLVLAAACLVERSRLDNYRAALERARQERPELHFLASGPWPPYTFANIDLEFKTHLGVS